MGHLPRSGVVNDLGVALELVNRQEPVVSRWLILGRYAQPAMVRIKLFRYGSLANPMAISRCQII